MLNVSIHFKNNIMVRLFTYYGKGPCVDTGCSHARYAGYLCYYMQLNRNEIIRSCDLFKSLLASSVWNPPTDMTRGYSNCLAHHSAKGITEIRTGLENGVENGTEN